MANNEANLITNTEGETYHLRLTAEDICPVVITAGDPDRIAIIAEHLDYKDKEISHREFYTVTGRIGSVRVLVISTGIGPDNIDIVMSELHTLYLKAVNKQYIPDTGLKIIRMGTSGSVHNDYPLDSILVTKKAVGIDNLPSFYNNSPWNSKEDDAPIPYYITETSRNLYTSFIKIKGSQVGNTLTCPGFYGPQGRKVHLTPRWNLPELISFFKERDLQISNIEMETAALFFFANALGHRAVSINALIAHRLTNQFSDNPGRVVQNMIRQAMMIIKEIGE